jgi:hypothetical protein
VQAVFSQQLGFAAEPARTQQPALGSVESQARAGAEQLSPQPNAFLASTGDASMAMLSTNAVNWDSGAATMRKDNASFRKVRTKFVRSDVANGSSSF